LWIGGIVGWPNTLAVVFERVSYHDRENKHRSTPHFGCRLLSVLKKTESETNTDERSPLYFQAEGTNLDGDAAGLPMVPGRPLFGAGSKENW